MRKMIEPFLIAEIASDRMEEDMLYYYDSQGQLLADVYQQDGQFCSATFYGEGEFKHVTKEQAVEIAEATKKVFGQDHLQLQSIEREEEGYLAEFRRIEPVYGLLVQGVGLFVTVTDTGFVASVTLHELDIEICYPETMISKEEARALIQQQSILQLGIAREMGWQYTYKPNYDLFGVDPDGDVIEKIKYTARVTNNSSAIWFKRSAKGTHVSCAAVISTVLALYTFSFLFSLSAVFTAFWGVSVSSPPHAASPSEKSNVAPHIRHATAKIISFHEEIKA